MGHRPLGAVILLHTDLGLSLEDVADNLGVRGGPIGFRLRTPCAYCTPCVLPMNDGQCMRSPDDPTGRPCADYLPDIVAQAGRLRRRPAGTFLEGWFFMDISMRRQGPRAAVLFAALILLVALLAAGIVYVGSHVTKPERLLGLPTTPGGWERVPIKLPAGQTGRVVSLAAAPRGSLALVEVGEVEEGPYELFATMRGDSWVRVPPDAYPVIDHDGANWALHGSDRGFLLSENGDVWFSADGFDWQVMARRTENPDLAHGEMQRVEAGGPGYVAVGNNNSTWYSTDGSDWTLAQVQPPPAEFFESQGFAAPEWGMDGLAVAGDKLIAWGNASQNIGVMWTSRDGRSWSNVPYVLGPSDNNGPGALAAGPRGFVAVFEDGGQLVFRASADGSTWEQVHSLGAARSTDADGTQLELSVSSIAASDAGCGGAKRPVVVRGRQRLWRSPPVAQLW